MESPDQNNTSPDSSIEIPMDTSTRYMLDPCEKKMNIIYILVLHKLLKSNLKENKNPTLKPRQNGCHLQATLTTLFPAMKTVIFLIKFDCFFFQRVL